MTSKCDSGASEGTKLPSILGGHGCLVAAAPNIKPDIASPKQLATSWAVEVRTRIRESIECHENVNEDDIMTLKNELTGAFISTLQQDSYNQWRVFVEILELVEPYKEFIDYFDTKTEFCHYVERVLYHLNVHKEHMFDLHVESSLLKVFPELVQEIQARGQSPVRNYCASAVSAKSVSSSQQLCVQKSAKSHKYQNKLLPDGTNPYTTYIPSDEEILGSRKLTLRDISKSMSTVALEMAARETVWGSHLGTTALALATDLPGFGDQECEANKMDFDKGIASQAVPFSLKLMKTPRPVPKMQEDIPTMNGREAVQYFASCHHLGKIKSLFLNIAPNQHYRPYDLITVNKSKANPEHYIFSTFGVLHVYPDRPSESMSLAEWQREAVLWEAVSHIPFFKNYLKSKIFYRWRANHLRIEFQRRRRRIIKNLLFAMPPFGAALLHISRLLKELHTVSFLPMEIDKSYQLKEFESCVNLKNADAEKLLDRFFRYCKMIVNFTTENAFKTLHHCDEQVKKKSIFTKDSIFMQKKKKQERENNLKEAKRQIKFLGNFVKLVDQMIIEHMFEITKTQGQKFIHSVLNIGSDTPREGFFRASLIFNDHDALALSPTKDQFQEVLSNTLQRVPNVLISRAISTDGCALEKDSEEQDHLSSHDPASSKIKDRAKLVTGFHDAHGLMSDSHQQHRSEAGEAKSAKIMIEDVPVMPELHRQKTPTKEEDDLGVATPDLVVMHTDDYNIQVEGEGFIGQYSPLSKANLDEKLLLDEDYQASLKKQAVLMCAALDEIDGFCEFNMWMNDIQQFCCSWNDKSVLEFRGATVLAVEQKLTEIRQWSERVRNFDTGFMTENGLFYIDCTTVIEDLLLKLDAIFQESISFVTDEATSLAKNFSDEMDTILKNMKDKRPDVSSFATFAKNLNEYKENTLHFQQRAEYIRSLYEVIRMCSRQLVPEDEKIEEKVWSSWEAFLVRMQDATEFVNTQTPLMVQQLEETFQQLSKDAAQQAELATTGKFFDPSENPMKILAEMNLIRQKFIEAQSQLQEASQWKEAITGEAYDLKFLKDMTFKMDVRQELWKFVEASTHTIKDWKQMLLKKMNIEKALERVQEWQSVADQLKPFLPEGDPVLSSWQKQIADFWKDLPLLQKLSNDVLQERHWHTIFLGMNEPFDPHHSFTVAELMSCNLSDHAGLINTIYKNALQEFDLQQNLNRIISFWQDHHFKLAKHIPESLFSKGKDPLKKSLSGDWRLRKLERFHLERAATAMSGQQKSLDQANDDLYILIDVEELKYHLEDNRISMDAMLASPNIGDIKDQVVFWCQALREIDEIVDLWMDCQKKWLYLLKIFVHAELYERFLEQAYKFEDIHSKFKDWMRVVSNDSKCLSVVNKRRGDKGYRLLQGDNLRSLLLSISKEQENILKNLEHFTEKSRSNFPRLYFLSNLDIVSLLGVCRNLQEFVPFIRKCFPNIQNVAFALPQTMSGSISQLDFAIHSDKLEAVSIEGACDEQLPLYTRVGAMFSVTKWLHNLNEVLKNTMTIAMRACVQARIEEGSRQPILILEELARLGSKNAQQEKSNRKIRPTFHHWLLRFPVQCVITTEDIMWERGMTKTLEKQDKDELKMLRLNLCGKLAQLVEVLQEVLSRTQISITDKQRLELLISGLIIQSIYHKDIMDKLIASNQVIDSAFDWLKIMKFRMDIRNVLCAKTILTENSNVNITGSNKQKKAQRKLLSKSQKHSKVEAPKFTRTHTTVSTDYQFSTCYAQQLGNIFNYDYEYVGPSSHLVVTPLTERAFLALSNALKTFYCGTMIGPNGTGKSETVRQLAKILGCCIFTFSCHESITFSMMLQYLTGMVHSGCWALFDDTDRLTKGLMSVVGQQLDYLRTALRALDISNENQYQIRGHSHFDKVFAMKSGLGDKIIRRNSLTTLHPLPKMKVKPSPILERQRTVPHGFNEKGLVTYFEDTWVAERDQRRHSIEREIEIKESDLYKSNKPPPLFYEHVKANKRRASPDYSRLSTEPLYTHRILGNVMFNGKLIQASSNFGCFMTLNVNNPALTDIPYNFRVLMRPCALIVPDTEYIISVTLQTYGYHKHKIWAKKLILVFNSLEAHMPKYQQHKLRDVKRVLMLAATKKMDSEFLNKIKEDSDNTCNDSWKKSSDALDIQTVAEEHSLVFALENILISRYEKASEVTVFFDILQEVFPHVAKKQAKSESSSGSQQITTAIKEVFKEDHLETNEVMFDKIMQLCSALDSNDPVILVGPAGSGKTKICQILSRAINKLNFKLYSADHSKDELSTDKNMQFKPKIKLKFLKDMEYGLKQTEATGTENMEKIKPEGAMMKDVSSPDEILMKPSKDFEDYPKIDLVHIFPCSMTPQELMGTFEDGIWHGGLLEKIISDSYFIWLATKTFMDNQRIQDRKSSKIPTEVPSLLKRWLVLDGDLDISWTEEIKTLLGDEKRLSLGSGESVILKDTTNIIFETCDLKNSSPSMISRCAVVHCGSGTTSWSALYFTWKQTASMKWLLSTAGLKVLDDLANDIFPSTVKFLTSECQTALLTDVGRDAIISNQVMPGVSEVSAFLQIFSAMLDRSLNREDAEKKVVWEETGSRMGNNSREMSSRLTTSSQIETIPNYKQNLKGMFAFSYIWAFGGHLHDRFREKFSKFAYDTLYQARHSIRLPPSGHIFDYYLDESTACFVNWSDRQLYGHSRSLSGFVVIPEVERYVYLLELLMASHQPILLIGEPGIGKSSLVQHILMSKTPSTTVTMSQGLTSSILQEMLLSRVMDIQAKENTTVGTSVTSSNLARQKHLLFIDDLNMAPAIGSYQPSLELIRCVFSGGRVYGRHIKHFQKLEDFTFIAATTLPSVPGNGLSVASHVMSSRLTRQFVNLMMFTPSDASLVGLFSKPLLMWLEEFPAYAVEHHFEFSKAMSQALLELYQLVKVKLRPSPLQPHYIFSLHDLHHTVQGALLRSPRTNIKRVKTKKKEGNIAPVMKIIARLWCHEVSRCFRDRIVKTDDQTWFSQTVESLVIKYFCSSRASTKSEVASDICDSHVDEEPNELHPLVLQPNIITSKLDEPKDTAREKVDKGDFMLAEQSVLEDGLDMTSSRSALDSSLKRDSSKDEQLNLPNAIFHHRSHARTAIPKAEAKLPDTSKLYDSSCDIASHLNKETESKEESLAPDHNETDSDESSLKSPYPGQSPSILAGSNELGKKNLKPLDNNGARDTPYWRQQRSPRTKLSVTFKTSQITRKDKETYYGPLLSFEDIVTGNTSLTGIIFSKFYMAYHTETQDMPVEKGYAMQTEESLCEALTTCLSRYNKDTKQRLNLVFFSEAVHHAARLSRVLAHSKGHALLLGVGYSTGRATLARLASYVAQCKLFEPKTQLLHEDNSSVAHKHIKLSCFHAGINGKPTVLLVHEEMGDEVLQNVSAIMAEGTVPGIYTEDEIQDIVSHMMPGGVQTKRVEKVQQAFERFVRQVKQNLHVLLCLNLRGNSFATDSDGLHHKLQRYPNLIKNSFSIDLYMPWSFKTLSYVANVWLQDTSSKITVPWKTQQRAEQIEMVSNGMAYIHKTAKDVLERQFCHQKKPLRIFTPVTLLEFIHLFKVICAFLVQTEKAKGVKYEQALSKIDEAFGSIADYRTKVSDLMPQSNSAGGFIKDLVSQVENLKQSYREALDKCKAQEEKIIQLQEPLENLRKSAQTEFDKVNPSYQAAAKVLDNLDHAAVEELRSYPSPPDNVKLVMKAVCLLFGKPQTWEAAKSLMVDIGFFQELIFYKKDDMSDAIFAELETYVSNPLFTPENVAQASTAASSVCAWIHAVFFYSSIHRRMKPHLKTLLDEESKIAKAQAQLGQMRMEANQIKANLEQYISEHKEALKAAKTIDKKIQAIEHKIACAINLMENMSVQHFLWRSELKKTRRQVTSAPGDALITSASLVYHGPLDDRFRQDLLHDWLDCMKQNAFDAKTLMDREPYSVITRVEIPMQACLQQSQEHQTRSNVRDSFAAATNTKSGSKFAQVKTFKYISSVYEVSSYYTSELKKQDTMYTAIPDDFMDDSDDDENCILPARPNLTIQEILSDFDELSVWHMQNLPTDLHSIQNALMLRMCCHNYKHSWPLLIDPDNQAEIWVRALQNSQNVFTEKDVVDAVVDDVIPLEDCDIQKNEQEQDALDVTDKPPPASQSLNISSFKILNGQESPSHHSDNSHELQQIMSSDSDHEKVEAGVGVPNTNMWVLVADDPDINTKLTTAIVHGATVLVTHLERKPLDYTFRGLLKKQFYVDKCGNKVLKVGDVAITCHPNFSLFLSTSVPLFIEGDGMHSFHLKHACVINMAISDEAIINRLMFETMKIEKKEFEGQRKSNENDFILHCKHLAEQHEIIREKTLNLNGPLLEDKTMLDSLKMCHTNVEHNRQILAEARYMGDHIEGKFAPYTSFVRMSAMLYGVIRRISVLYPFYYMPFYKYVELFSNIVRNRDRGKGSLGAPAARAQELSDAVLNAVFKYMKLMLFEEHYNLLSLMVSLERMLRLHKASNKELSLFINGMQKIGFDDDFALEQKPKWMKYRAWTECCILESIHQSFRGLCLSITNNSDHWSEYFQQQLNLVNPVPGTTLQELSIFQKCLLWKFIFPNKLAELSKSLVLCELGRSIDLPDNYSIFEVYKLTDKYTPTVFILPSVEGGPNVDGTVGYPSMCPAQEVKLLSRQTGMEGKVRIINLGVQNQMTEVKNAMRDCLQMGHWLLLQNYHFTEEADAEFLTMLRDIIYARWLEDDNKTGKADTHDEGRRLVTTSQLPTNITTNGKIHPSFRLWITTQIKQGRTLPGLLIQHGLRVTCEATANFKNLLGRTYKSTALLMSTDTANNEKMGQNFVKVMPIALLHALILQQSYYRRPAFVHHHFWTATDLAALVDVISRPNEWTAEIGAVADLASWVYTRHCQDLSDARAVSAVINDLVQHAISTRRTLSTEAKGVNQLLYKLISSFKETGELQKTLDSIEDTTVRVLSLPVEVHEQLTAEKSRVLQKELGLATGATELISTFQNPSGALTSTKATNIITSLLTLLSSSIELPVNCSSQIKPLDLFFSQEVASFKELFQSIQDDLMILIRAVNAEISLTAKMNSMLEDIYNDVVPDVWLESTHPTSSSLKLWLSELSSRMKYVRECLIKCPVTLSLNMFLRPDRLFRVIIRTYAQYNFKNTSDVTLDFQVMPRDFAPSMPPDRGIFIDGLQLKNASWDSMRSVLTEITCAHTVHTFPIIWAKPSTDKDSDGSDDERIKCDLYLCPLYSAEDSNQQSDFNILWQIPLATTESPTLWAQMRVALTLDAVKL